MLPNVLIILSSALTMISLNGILGALARCRKQVPGPHRADPEPVIDDDDCDWLRDQVDSLSRAELISRLTGPIAGISATKAAPHPGGLLPGLNRRVSPVPVPAPSAAKEEPPPATDQIVSGNFLLKTLDVLAQPSWTSIAAFGILVAAALVFSIIALFIVLDFFPTVLISLAALLTVAASALVIKTRYARNAWLPVAGPADPVITPAMPARAPAPVPGAEEDDAVPGPDNPSLAELERYWVDEPFSYVKIKRTGTQGFVYTVFEPPISKREKTILQETYAQLREIIVYDTTDADRKDHFNPAVISRIIREFDPAIEQDRLDILVYYLKRDLTGYGPLEVAMRDPALEDLSCNGKELPVFVFHKFYGSLPTNILFAEGELDQFVLKLAQKANKQISLSSPMVDATLPDGARVQITYSNVVSTKGSSFTIRKFRAEPMTPWDLIKFGTYSPKTLAFLWLAIENRKSILVVGGTASGKTSTMNAISLFIPQNAKIVSLEDTREIQLPHKNWLPTQTRELNVEGVRGDIDLFSLLKASMRQRPEYIIVGEVRGREAQTLFQAMNTGHATLSTIHAGTVHEAINRLTHDPINVPPVMFQALDLVVVQSIFTIGKGRIRRNLSIHEIEVDSHGTITTVPLFEWNIHTDLFRQVYKKSRILDEIAEHYGWSEEDLRRELKKREEFFGWALMVEKPSIHDLANAIHELGD